MKFTRFITFSLIGALSIGTVVGAQALNKTPVDRQFTIEDLSGDRSVINSIALENIIKVDADSYENVSLTANDVTFEETKYDRLLQADETILNNKEMYRGAIDALTLENDLYMITADFNKFYPYASNEPTLKLAVKDKETNEVNKETVTLPNYNSTQMNWQAMELFEMNNNYYYAAVEYKYKNNNTYPTMKIYQIDVAALKLKEVAAIEVLGDEQNPSGYTEITSIVSDGDNVYGFITSGSEYELLSYNIADNTQQIIEIASDVKEDTYYKLETVSGNDLYVSSNGDLIKLTIADGTATVAAEYSPLFKDKYDYVWTVDYLIENETLYVITAGENYATNDSYPYINAYQLTTGKLLYEGKLPSMADRGVGKDYSFAEN